MPGKIHGLTSIATQEATLAVVERWVVRSVAPGRPTPSRRDPRSCTSSTRSPRPAARNGAWSRRSWRSSDRFDQRVVRLFERDDLQDRLERAGIPVDRARTERPAGRPDVAVGRAPACTPQLRRWRPDVVHTTLFSANLVGQLAARPLRIPVVSSFNRTGEIAPPAGPAARRGRLARSDDARHRPPRRPVRRRALPGRQRLRPGQQLRAVRRPARAGHGRAPRHRRGAAVAGGGSVGVRTARPACRCSSTSPGWCRRRRSTCSSTRSPTCAPALPDAELAIAGAAGSAEPDGAGGHRPSRSRRRRTPARLARRTPRPSSPPPTSSCSAPCPRARRAPCSRRWRSGHRSSPSTSRRWSS